MALTRKKKIIIAVSAVAVLGADHHYQRLCQP